MSNPQQEASSKSSQRGASSSSEAHQQTTNPSSSQPFGFDDASTRSASSTIMVESNSSTGGLTFVNETPTIHHSQQQQQLPPLQQQQHDVTSTTQRVSPPTSSSATSNMSGNPNTSLNTPASNSNNTANPTFIKFLQPTHALRIKKLVTDEQFASNYTELRLTKIPAIYGNQQIVMHGQKLPSTTRGSKSRRRAPKSQPPQQPQQPRTTLTAHAQHPVQHAHHQHTKDNDIMQQPPSPSVLIGMQPQPTALDTTMDANNNTLVESTSSFNVHSLPQIQQFPPFSDSIPRQQPEPFNFSSPMDVASTQPLQGSVNTCNFNSMGITTNVSSNYVDHAITSTTTSTPRDVNNSSSGVGFTFMGGHQSNNSLQAIQTRKQPEVYPTSSPDRVPSVSSVFTSISQNINYSSRVNNLSGQQDLSTQPPPSHVNTPFTSISSLSPPLHGPQGLSTLQLHQAEIASNVSSLSPPSTTGIESRLDDDDGSVFPLKLSIEDILLELHRQHHQ